MLHRLQHISDLAAILKKHGLQNAVISPGSRNAPLINAFTATFQKGCYNIVDERSAAYFALGIATRTEKPVALISTSGTAALNFAPAVAEAFHLGVSLLVITADRPPEWINQQDNQTINQQGIFSANSKASYQLPVDIHSNDDLWYAQRLVNEAWLQAQSNKPGPVHINVPLKEPLYDKLPDASEALQIFSNDQVISKLSPVSKLKDYWQKANKILIVIGQNQPDKRLSQQIDVLNKDGRVVVLSEIQSNISTKQIVNHTDLVLVQQTQLDKLKPDLVLYLGGQFISKRLKSLLRETKGCEFVQIGKQDQLIDTYKNLSLVVSGNPVEIQSELSSVTLDESEFKSNWISLNKRIIEKREAFLKEAPHSDLRTLYAFCRELPKDALVFAGNSSIIRYLQYFNQHQRCFYANRGTSGIDGTLSTASGIAASVSEEVYAIIGDLSFVYDSNALWNKRLPSNLKVIVINNSGGGIFSLIEGPSKSEAFADFFEAYHPVEIRKIAEAFTVNYASASNEDELKSGISEFLKDRGKPSIFEIFTPKEKNPLILKEFLTYLKE